MALLAKRENKSTILDKPLSRGKTEINVSTFALLFSEMVQYCQNRVNTVPELQNKLSEMGYHVGLRILDVLVVRESGFKRETKLLRILMFVKSNMWKSLFGKEADKLERDNDDEKMYYIIEKEPLVNRFISFGSETGRQGGGVNCAAFVAGIIEAVLNSSNFPCKVSAHWHKGTAFLIKFDESVIARDKTVEGR